MMTRAQAEAYGRKTGCRYYVKNDKGGLMGGFKTLERAEECKREWEQKMKNDPWDKEMRFFIEER